mgnify:CR=1 FL=1
MDAILPYNFLNKNENGRNFRQFGDKEFRITKNWTEMSN